MSDDINSFDHLRKNEDFVGFDLIGGSMDHVGVFVEVPRVRHQIERRWKRVASGLVEQFRAVFMQHPGIGLQNVCQFDLEDRLFILCNAGIDISIPGILLKIGNERSEPNSIIFKIILDYYLHEKPATIEPQLLQELATQKRSSLQSSDLDF
jgi:hypothetical protein